VEDHRVLYSCFNIPNLFPHKSSHTRFQPPVEFLITHFATADLDFSQTDFPSASSEVVLTFLPLFQAFFFSARFPFHEKFLKFLYKKNKTLPPAQRRQGTPRSPCDIKSVIGRASLPVISYSVTLESGSPLAKISLNHT
jgi:hypothetical protein